MTATVSASQIKNKRSCLRRWGFRYLDGLPEPQTPEQAQGVAGHSKIEEYLKHGVHPGEDHIGQLIQKAMRPGILPIPRPSLLVEHGFTLALQSVPDAHFRGFIDVLAPPVHDNNPTIYDWKFTSSLFWAMDVDKLRDDAQGISYSAAALARWPESTAVDNTWVYFDHKAKKVLPVTLRRTADEVIDAWGKMDVEAGELVKLKRMGVRAVDLPGDESAQACGEFKGCPHASRCDIGRRSKGGSFSNKAFTTGVNSSNTQHAAEAVTDKGKMKMAKSLEEQLEQLRLKKSGQAQAATPAPKTENVAAPVTAPVAVPKTEAVAAAPVNATVTEMPKKRSLAEIQAARGAKGVNPPAATTPVTPQPAPAVVAVPVPVVSAVPAPIEAAQVVAPIHQSGSMNPVAVVTSIPTVEKKTRAKKTIETATTMSDVVNAMLSPAQLVVYCHAVPLKMKDGKAPVHLIELIGPVMRAVADENEKAHWGLIPYDSKARLAQAVDAWLTESKWKGSVLLDPSTLEGQAVVDVFRAHSDEFVWGLAS
jgi:hypothetical protein